MGQVMIFLFLYCCFSFFDVPVTVSDINWLLQS